MGGKMKDFGSIFGRRRDIKRDKNKQGKRTNKGGPFFGKWVVPGGHGDL